ncbi:riboflavin synthase [candidate division WOR-3 bacterium]|nr:riboflavin synthase [candidate division WOR-3 bacterium]
MFTGLIEETGVIKRIAGKGTFWDITISCHKTLEGLSPGDSVCVDGTCLTAVEKGTHDFRAQLSMTTVKTTKAKYYKTGSVVNLERALKADGRIGGHFVQGHVEGIGKIRKFLRSPGNSSLDVSVPKEVYGKIISKGYIAIDGVSLTVNYIKGSILRVTVIEETFKRTNLKFARAGMPVNIESDFMSPQTRSA